MLASGGRNTSCPAAAAEASNPSTRPRRAVNQRVAIVAASTLAIAPVPQPTTMPHSRMSCHDCCISGVAATPSAISASAPSIVRRTPIVSMRAAANGPISP